MPDETLQRQVSRIVKTDPDPTVATKEYVKSAVDAAVAPLKQQLTSNDKAVDLLAVKQAAEPQASQVASDVIHLKELTQTQLRERDVRVEQVKEDGEKAIAAALQAQKEAVGKTELGFTKELDSVKLNMNTLAEGLRLQLEDVKQLVSTTIPRTEVAAAIATISDRLATLEKMMASQQGSLLMASFFASAIPTVVAVLLFFLRK